MKPRVSACVCVWDLACVRARVSPLIGDTRNTRGCSEAPFQGFRGAEGPADQSGWWWL